MSDNDKYRPSKYTPANSKRKPNKPTPMEGTTPSSGKESAIGEVASYWMEQVKSKSKNKSVYYISTSPGTSTTDYNVVWSNGTPTVSYWTLWNQEY